MIERVTSEVQNNCLLGFTGDNSTENFQKLKHFRDHQVGSRGGFWGEGWVSVKWGVAPHSASAPEPAPTCANSTVTMASPQAHGPRRVWARTMGLEGPGGRKHAAWGRGDGTPAVLCPRGAWSLSLRCAALTGRCPRPPVCMLACLSPWERPRPPPEETHPSLQGASGGGSWTETCHRGGAIQGAEERRRQQGVTGGEREESSGRAVGEGRSSTSRPRGSEGGQRMQSDPHGKVRRRRDPQLGSTHGGFTHRMVAVGLTMLDTAPH